MCEVYSVVAIYDSHSQAETAVKELQMSGIDMKKISIVGEVKTERVMLIYDVPWAFPLKGPTYQPAHGERTAAPSATWNTGGGAPIDRDSQQG